MNIQLTLAARYLFGRKLRTFLTTLAVVFGVMVLFGMNVMLPTLIGAFRANLMAAAGQVDATITHKAGAAFPASTLEKVAAVEGVSAAAGYLSRPVNVPVDFYDRDPRKADVTATLLLVGLDPAAGQTLHSYSVEAGRFVEADDVGAAVISASLANTLGLKVGDTLTIPATQGVVDLTIVGLRPTRAIPGNEEVILPLAEAQRLLDQPDQINLIEANYNTTDEVEREKIDEAIRAAIGEGYQFEPLPTGTELFTGMQTAQIGLSVLGVLALFMGGFIIFNTFRTIIAERKRDIALLRAVGANRRTLLGVILAEGALQGGLGTLAGMAMGYLMAAGLMMAVSPLVESYIRLRFGAPIVSPSLVVITVALGMGTTLIAGLIPAVNASRVTPLEAMRPPTVEGCQRAAGLSAIAGSALLVLAVLALLAGNVALAGLGAILFFVGLVLAAPALVRPMARAFGAAAAATFARDGAGSIAEGNMARQPGRAAVTASTTMIALAIIVTAGGLVSSVVGAFTDIARKSLGSDYLFMPPSIGVWSSNVGAQSDLADEVRAVGGVGPVSTLRYAAAAANGTPISIIGIDPAAFPQTGGLEFFEGDESAYRELAAGRAMIVNGVYASAAGVKVGDPVEVLTPDGTQTYRVVARGSDYMNAKIATGYISQANLAADFRKTEDVFIQLDLAPGADAEAVDRRLREIAADYPQFTLVSGLAFVAETERVFTGAFAALYTLLGVLAVPSLIAMLNTLAIGVIERTREIGVLRAIGSTQKQVGRMVTAEALLLAAAGTAFGLLAGLYMSYVLVIGIHAAGFPVDYSFPLSGLLVAIAVGLLFGVLAAIIPARQAARLEIVEALRYE